jgi:DNA-binding transcriptional LysR family regulator
MQRLVQERFARLGANLRTVMELNTLDAFRGVVRQGELIALLPQSALLEARTDSSLSIRVIANPQSSLTASNTAVSDTSTSDSSLMRQVVLVTTQDRLQVPPIQHFCQLVRQLEKPFVSETSSSKPMTKFHSSFDSQQLTLGG